MMGEISEYFKYSMKKSIMDYILLEDEERIRLGIFGSFSKKH